MKLKNVMSLAVLALTVFALNILLNGCTGTRNGQKAEADISTSSLETNASNKNESQTRTVTFYTDDQKKDGYLVAIVQEAFKRAGYEVRIEYMPWARALYSVMNGENEALLGVYHNDERARKMSYTKAIGKTEYVFFKRKDKDIKYSNLEDLKTYKIGMQRSATINKEFDEATYLNKEPANDPRVNIKNLITGIVDLFIEQRDVVSQYLKEYYPNDIDSIVSIEPPFLVKEYFCAFSKDFQNYEQKVSDFNRGLKMITEDGTLQKLTAQHKHP